jgi:hypothetical protein
MCCRSRARSRSLDRRDRVPEQVDGHDQVLFLLPSPLAFHLDAQHARCTQLSRLLAHPTLGTDARLVEALCVVLILLVPQRSLREPEARIFRAVARDDVDHARTTHDTERPVAGRDELPEVAAAQIHERDRLVLLEVEAVGAERGADGRELDRARCVREPAAADANVDDGKGSGLARRMTHSCERLPTRVVVRRRALLEFQPAALVEVLLDGEGAFGK